MRPSLLFQFGPPIVSSCWYVPRHSGGIRTVALWAQPDEVPDRTRSPVPCNKSKPPQGTGIAACENSTSTSSTQAVYH